MLISDEATLHRLERERKNCENIYTGEADHSRLYWISGITFHPKFDRQTLQHNAVMVKYFSTSCQHCTLFETSIFLQMKPGSSFRLNSRGWLYDRSVPSRIITFDDYTKPICNDCLSNNKVLLDTYMACDKLGATFLIISDNDSFITSSSISNDVIASVMLVKFLIVRYLDRLGCGYYTAFTLMTSLLDSDKYTNFLRRTPASPIVSCGPVYYILDSWLRPKTEISVPQNRLSYMLHCCICIHT